MKSKITIVLIISISLFGIYFFINSESQLTEIPVADSIFKVIVPSDKLITDMNTRTITYEQANFELKPELSELYQEIGNFDGKQNTVVIYPTLTETAYSKNGFYDYYEKKCDSSCLSISIKTNFEGEFSSSRAAYQTLKLLNYETITDIDVDQNPDILSSYEKIILLHNEYVTKKIFNAITSHPNVIYLYPNALYAEIEIDHEKNIISLIRGHGFPESTIDNGFNWKFDNTRPYEFDIVCNNWEFQKIDNGYMLNCYPEYVIFKDIDMLKTIKNLNNNIIQEKLLE